MVPRLKTWRLKTWRILGTLCLIGMLTTASVQAAQEVEEQSKTPQTPKKTPQIQDAQQPRQTPTDQSRRTTGSEQPAMLGVRIEASPTTGVYVQDVMPQSPADRGGIDRQDYILSIDGQTISTPQDFDKALRQIQPNDKAEFVVWRNRQKQNLVVSFNEGQRTTRRPNYHSFDDQQPAMQDNTQDAAWLGVMLDTMKPNEQQAGEQKITQGVLIRGVYPSGPAARAGIYRDDIITQVDGKAVTSPAQFAQLISNHQPNETVELTLMRFNDKTTVKPTLGNRPDFAAYSMNAPQSDAQSYAGDYSDDDVTDHAIMLEQHRRFAEQHQRMEQRLDELINEVRSLRQELSKQK